MKMFCTNCGSPIPEGGKFCLNCGAAVEQQPADDFTPMQQAGETVVLTQPEETFPQQETEAAFAAPVFETPKKKSKNLFALIAGIVVVLAAAVALVLNLGSLKKTIAKTFGSPEKYMQQVHQDALADSNEDFAKAYGKTLSQMTAKSLSADMELKFVLTDDGKKVLSSVIPASEELTELLNIVNNLSISLESNVKNDLTSTMIGINAAGTEVPLIQTIVDMAKMKVYLTSSYFTDETLFADMSYSDMPAAYDPEMVEDLVKALPDEETLNKLLNKYTKVILAEIKDVDKESTTLSVGDMEQKVTALTCNLSQKDLVKIICAVLEEVKDDDDIRKIVESMQSFMEENDLYYEDEDIYEMMIEGIEELLDESDDALEEADSSDMIALTSFVNNKHEITGFSISVDDEEVFTYGCVFNGKDFATEIKAYVTASEISVDGDYSTIKQEAFAIKGEGTKEKGIVNARYSVSAMDMTGLTIEVKDFDENAFEENGYIKGSFEIIPSKELLEESIGLDDEVASAINLANPSILIVMNSDETTANTELYICGAGNKLAGIVLNATTGEGKNISVPSNSTEIIDGDEVAEWIAGFDLEKLKPIVEKLNLPAELSDIVNAFIDAGGFGALMDAQYSDAVAYSAA